MIRRSTKITNGTPVSDYGKYMGLHHYVFSIIGLVEGALATMPKVQWENAEWTITPSEDCTEAMVEFSAMTESKHQVSSVITVRHDGLSYLGTTGGFQASGITAGKLIQTIEEEVNTTE